MGPTDGEILTWFLIQVGIPMALIVTILVVFFKFSSSAMKEDVLVECKKCHTKGIMKRSALVWCPRSLGERYITCPTCQKKVWHKVKTYIKKD